MYFFKPLLSINHVAVGHWHRVSRGVYPSPRSAGYSGSQCTMFSCFLFCICIFAHVHRYWWDLSLVLILCNIHEFFKSLPGTQLELLVLPRITVQVPGGQAVHGSVWLSLSLYFPYGHTKQSSPAKFNSLPLPQTEVPIV